MVAHKFYEDAIMLSQNIIQLLTNEALDMM